MTGYATVSDFGEKGIIKELIRPLCESSKIPLGVGDDAAMLEIPAGLHMLVSTDKIPEDLLAIQLGLMDSFKHGRYLATVNISDIAAMGGIPIGLLATLALPADFSFDYLREFIRGFVAGGAEWDAPVVGGDTGWGSSVCLSATIIGAVEPDKVLTRSGARPNDTVFVTGPVGGFGTALAYFTVAKPRGLNLPPDQEAWLLDRLILPQARVDAGRRLATSGVCKACMDITDGVSQSLRELAAASGYSFVIDEHRLPIHPATSTVAAFLEVPVRRIVFGIGLDLELIGALACGLDTIPQGLADLVYPIGQVQEGQPEAFIADGAVVLPVPKNGWQHFSTRAMDMVRQLCSNEPLPR